CPSSGPGSVPASSATDGPRRRGRAGPRRPARGCPPCGSPAPWTRWPRHQSSGQGSEPRLQRVPIESQLADDLPLQLDNRYALEEPAEQAVVPIDVHLLEL